jgi:hypothetical protein
VLDHPIHTIIFAGVSIFLATCLLWKKPDSYAGKLSLKLCCVNAFGWLILLPLLSDRGHPPSWLFPALLFWLVNFVLLPATATIIWICQRNGEERASYLAIASVYVVMNIAVLYIVPLIWFMKEANH